TAATGLDALTHCIEAYANRFAHPLVDVDALQGIRLIGQHLLAAVADHKIGGFLRVAPIFNTSIAIGRFRTRKQKQSEVPKPSDLVVLQ
ncbi:MAG: iron-containing alcohol dehydrogenase, partial [Acidobacteriota bacterium]